MRAAPHSDGSEPLFLHAEAVGLEHGSLVFDQDGAAFEPREDQPAFLWRPSAEKADEITKRRPLLEDEENEIWLDLGAKLAQPGEDDNTEARLSAARLHISRRRRSLSESPRQSARRLAQNKVRRRDNWGAAVAGIVALAISIAPLYWIIISFFYEADAAIDQVLENDGKILEGQRDIQERLQALQLGIAALPNYVEPANLDMAAAQVWLLGTVQEADEKACESESLTRVGTGWALNTGDGIRLVTNAHVEGQLARPGEIACARRVDDERPISIPIRVSGGDMGSPPLVHPDYRALKTWESGLSEKEKGQLGAVYNAYDVALLSAVEETDNVRLGQGLQIAAREDLYAVTGGDELGYVGFPFENLGPASPQPQAPTAVYVRGVVAKVSNEFGVGGALPARRHMLTMDLSATGGSSGSPLLNREGRVVGMVSGGDTLCAPRNGYLTASACRVGDADNLRLPLGFTYAIRADVIDELRQDPETRADRLARWGDLFVDYTGDDPAEFAVHQWRLDVCNGAVARPPIIDARLRLDGDGYAQAPINLPVDQPISILMEHRGDAAGHFSFGVALNGVERRKSQFMATVSKGFLSTTLTESGNAHLAAEGAPDVELEYRVFACSDLDQTL
ncbi:MAG: serine protease [Pseudomonadota bacterium]